MRVQGFGFLAFLGFRDYGRVFGFRVLGFRVGTVGFSGFRD